LILGLIALAFLLVLSILVAVAAFTQKFNKRIWISGIIVIALGLGSFAGALMSYSYQQQKFYQEVQRDTVETALKLPEDFKSVRSIEVDIPTMSNLVYVVDDTNSSLKQRIYKQSPQVKVVVLNGVAKISLATSDQKNMIATSTITLYGPRLDSILVSNGYVSYDSGSQTNLKTEVYNSSSLRIVGSRIDELTAKTDSNAQLSTEDAAVSSVNLSIFGASSVALGNIKSMNVTNPEVCASSQTAQLTVQDIVNATYLRNNNEVASRSTDGSCLDIQFAEDAYYGSDQR
jgi:hypothetical protein